MIKKKSNDLSRLILISAILSVAGISFLVFNSCSTSFEQADTFQRTFNDHAEGWMNLFVLLGALSGWLVTLVNWLRQRFEFRSKGSTDVQNKRPVLPFLTINGKSLFRQ